MLPETVDPLAAAGSMLKLPSPMLLPGLYGCDADPAGPTITSFGGLLMISKNRGEALKHGLCTGESKQNCAWTTSIQFRSLVSVNPHPTVDPGAPEIAPPGLRKRTGPAVNAAA